MSASGKMASLLSACVCLCISNRVNCFVFPFIRYYMRESKGSKRWLLYLAGEHECRRHTTFGERQPECNLRCDVQCVCPGGWYCFNKQTCDRRYEMMRSLMSSTNWPQTRTGSKTLTSVPARSATRSFSLPPLNTQVASHHPGIRATLQCIAQLLPKSVKRREKSLLCCSFIY